MGVINKIVGTHSQRELKRHNHTIEKILSLKPEMEKLTDDEMKAKTTEFRNRLQKGETLDDLLPEAFALVREATRRTLGTEHYPCQLQGGIILHQGRIAEMKTGEGKTLVSTLPAYLNALEGKGVHVVTVNDYLAARDAEWMGAIHEFLGLKVGIVLNSMKPEERKAAYACDITYVTNNELGFDYLRDNMAIYKEQLVLRDLHYAIIDEVDSVLIDEARTPLIISGQSGKSTSLYEACDILARQLKRGDDVGEFSKMDAIMGIEQEENGDFVVNEKDKVVNLTAEGIEKVEKFFHIENLADPENLEIQNNIILALRAHNLMHRDKDYVVKEDQVLIVDEFTGRIMPGRRYSDGLHQAIEAKEHVKVKRESKTLATITFQNFFNKFEKKSGMTGTALTEEKEFRDIYGMDVVEIPTNRPVIRKDLHDAVYKTKKEKLNAIVEAVKEAHAKGQPVLVGTITIEAVTVGDGSFCAEAFYEGRRCGQAETTTAGGNVVVTLPLSEVHLWEAGAGRLYDLTITFGKDTVHSYFGLRNVTISGEKVLINGKSVFQRLVLDQGFYPDGIYTASTDEALENDVKLSMAAGFNGARLHEKVFEPVSCIIAIAWAILYGASRATGGWIRAHRMD